MSISIDYLTLIELGQKNPLYLSGWIFINGGWIAIVILFIVGLWIMRLETARMKYRKSIKYIILAVDIPKENEQSLKAVEQIFAQLAAVESKGTLYERYWLGKVQDTFSLELVSIEGYIQFLIRAPEHHRDIVEAAIYAQYIDAEITEVYDYTENIPNEYPNKEYDLWGTELILAKSEVYPIRTYHQFEHPLTQTFADPMASILEAMSRLLPGEQIWLQLVVTPIDSSWAKRGEQVVKKLIGQKIEKRKSLISPITDVTRGFSDEALKQITGAGLSPVTEVKKVEHPSLMQYLSPGHKAIIEAIETKISKIGFKTKIRIIYVAKKEVFNKHRGVNPIIGGMMQFNTFDLNAFKPQKKIRTKVHYFMVKKRMAWRQRRILRAYKRRANYLGWGLGKVLNLEELASIYHFPISEITAPLVKKTEGKKGGPPATLPKETFISEITPMAESTAKEKMIKAPVIPKAKAPINLPVEETEKNSYDQ